MRASAPPSFDLLEFYSGIFLFQEWELFPGHLAKGLKNVANSAKILRMPERMDGLRVLDIAPWNGFFGFECLRRGAKELVSVGPEDPRDTGYAQTVELLEIERCRYVRDSVYNLSSETIGTFDVVLFLGLLYHLRHPLFALDRAYDVFEPEGLLFIDSPVIDRRVSDRTISADKAKEIVRSGQLYNQELPIAYFSKASETGDPYNWFMPNEKCFQAFVESAGFSIESVVNEATWSSISARKGQRNFVVGFEGFNPGSAKTKK